MKQERARNTTTSSEEREQVYALAQRPNDDVDKVS